MMARLQHVMRRIPVLGPLAGAIYRRLRGTHPDAESFAGSVAYWEERYAAGGDSGAGSYGKLARFKAGVINAFVADHEIDSVIEFGSGDGHQLSLATYPRYVGYDVSDSAVARCRTHYASDPTKSFALLSEYGGEQADLALSLDVIYHLVEQDVFESHMRALFGAARRFVIIYSSNEDGGGQLGGAHEEHRCFTPWVEAHISGWKLIERIPNAFAYRERTGTGSLADFYVYAKDTSVPSQQPGAGPPRKT